MAQYFIHTRNAFPQESKDQQKPQETRKSLINKPLVFNISPFPLTPSA